MVKPSWCIEKSQTFDLLVTMQEQLNAFLRQHSVLPTSDRETNLRLSLDIIRQAKTFQTTPYKAWTAELKRCTRRKKRNTQVSTKVPPSYAPKKTEPNRKPKLGSTNKEPEKKHTNVQATNDNNAELDKGRVESPSTADELDYIVCDAEPSGTCTIL